MVYHLISVTRFGEISPIGQDFKSLWQNFKCLICIWQNYEPNLAQNIAIWPFFYVVKEPNFEQVI